MGSGEHESGKISFGNAKGNYGRAVSCDVITFSRFKIPFSAFAKFGISFFGKSFADVFYGMKGGRAFFDKIKKFFIHRELSPYKERFTFILYMFNEN